MRLLTRISSLIVVSHLQFRSAPHLLAMLARRKASNEEANEAAALPSSKVAKKSKSSTKDESQNLPWYQVFTKGDDEYNLYMRTEWGVESRTDVEIFEKLSLEGAQAGLSWLTILRKRQAYRKAFHSFDPVKVAKMTTKDVDRLVEMEGDKRDTIVRHRGKIESVINNAKQVIQLQKEYEHKKDSFAAFIWSFVDDKPILNSYTLENSPSLSEESAAMSKALKKKGFRFIGPTTCYSMMQATGMVIDHPFNSPEWKDARQRLSKRLGGYQERK